MGLVTETHDHLGEKGRRRQAILAQQKREREREDKNKSTDPPRGEKNKMRRDGTIDETPPTIKTQHSTERVGNNVRRKTGQRNIPPPLPAPPTFSNTTYLQGDFLPSIEINTDRYLQQGMSSTVSVCGGTMVKTSTVPRTVLFGRFRSRGTGHGDSRKRGARLERSPPFGGGAVEKIEIRLKIKQ